MSKIVIEVKHEFKGKKAKLFEQLLEDIKDRIDLHVGAILEEELDEAELAEDAWVESVTVVHD